MLGLGLSIPTIALSQSVGVPPVLHDLAFVLAGAAVIVAALVALQAPPG